MQVENKSPLVLCFSGLDPSGGAGIQADIETIACCGGHALPITSCLTVQNSMTASQCTPIDDQFLQQQAEALLQDMSIASCKIGVIPNAKTAQAIAGIITQLAEIPIVFDPVFAASAGKQFSDAATVEVIKELLLPLVTIITPNTNELIALSAENQSIDSRMRELCTYGPRYILLTGADEPTQEVTNTLFTEDGVLEKFDWPRLPHSYHGSGCTLSSAIACYLAKGITIIEAVRKAQQFTWQSLQAAQALGNGQWFPKRAISK